MTKKKILLLRKLRKQRLKTLKTDGNAGASQTTQTFRQQFVVTTTSSGEINLTAGSNETFSAKSNTDYELQSLLLVLQLVVVQILLPLVMLLTLMQVQLLLKHIGKLVTHLTITNPEILGNGAKVKVIATLTRTISSEKTKTNQSGHLVLVDADASAGAEYGTASQHKEISLGRADVYKLYGVFDSEDASANSTSSSVYCYWCFWYFTKGETIQGASSGANGVIINTTNPITFIVTNGKSFIANETNYW